MPAEARLLSDGRVAPLAESTISASPEIHASVVGDPLARTTLEILDASYNSRVEESYFLL
jgi:hypothetical protein